MELIRLSKVLSMRGICSRREADKLIESGQVLVEGKVVSELGTKINPDAKIELGKKAAQEKQNKVTILLNKPVGIVSAQPEKGYTAAIELINEENQAPGETKEFHHLHRKKLAVAGRLDIDSKGLLVFTQDGVIAKQLIGENTEVEKEYLVWVEGNVDNQVLGKLRVGLELDGKPLKRAKVRRIRENLLEIALKEGKKRQIRRMCELVGLRVTGLKRVRIGKIELGDLPEGRWRYLKPDENFL